ncbi:MAG: hypothetical protein IJU92_06450 [Spirochaetaceae bacterium]|nr:hypothetical protein [Spirochaetaceae bacterium]
MKLNAPKTVTWIICIVLLAIGFIGRVANLGIPFIQGANSFWWAFAAAALSLVASVFPGL